jgi:hypothetical protein
MKTVFIELRKIKWKGKLERGMNIYNKMIIINGRNDKLKWKNNNIWIIGKVKIKMRE